jgi:hypothetical protein
VRLGPEHDDRAICSDPSDIRAPESLFESVPASRRPAARFILAASIVVALVLVALVSLTAGHSPTRSHMRSSALIAAVPNRSAAATPSKHAPSKPPAHTQEPQSPQILPTLQPGVSRVSATLAAQLEAHGHELLQTGQSGSAVRVLERALAATGESVHGCEQPSSQQCLTGS